MSAINWKEIRGNEWVASNNLGRVVGKISKSYADSLYAVTEPPQALGEYITLGQAKAAVERVSSTVGRGV